MRVEFDYYPTPGKFTRAILSEWAEFVPVQGKFFEPCIGSHDIADSATLYRVPGVSLTEYVGNDLNPDRPAQTHLDAANPMMWEVYKRKYPEYLDTVITNPPYGALAAPIVKNAVKYARSVCVLVRLSFTEPCDDRGEFLEENPPNIIRIMPRYSFTGKGSDNSTVQWLIWDRRLENFQSFKSLSKESIKKFDYSDVKSKHLITG
jgi:hypothetical protein